MSEEADKRCVECGKEFPLGVERFEPASIRDMPVIQPTERPWIRRGVLLFCPECDEELFGTELRPFSEWLDKNENDEVGTR